MGALLVCYHQHGPLQLQPQLLIPKMPFSFIPPIDPSFALFCSLLFSSPSLGFSLPLLPLSLFYTCQDPAVLISNTLFE
ncbi:hypothetical protein VNO77_40236 [Canavalia gladiata]|uniref:Uncharacterized protein n=1 Tax=Canavalia gladiata TaxID=3824 RepID=A0AAN9JY58_CANGL